MVVGGAQKNLAQGSRALLKFSLMVNWNGILVEESAPASETCQELINMEEIT